MSEEDVTLKCPDCGKTSAVTAHTGSTVTCPCGHSFGVSRGRVAAGTEAAAVQALAEMTVRDPDELLAPVNRSIILKAFLISFMCHMAVVTLTSFSLYSDWKTFGVVTKEDGFMTPTKIKQKKHDLRLEQDKKEREEKRKAEEDRQQKGQAGDSQAGGAAKGAVGERELPEPQTLPPAASFELDEDGLGL